jgi:hypothetical protein
MVRLSVASAQVSSVLVPNPAGYCGLDAGSAVAWYIPDLPSALPSPREVKQ